MLIDESNESCRTLRPQGHGVSIAVIEGVHFFFNDIGRLTNQAREQRRALQKGQTYLFITMLRKDMPCGVFHLAVIPLFLRQQILHAADGFYGTTHALLSSAAGLASSAACFSATRARIMRSNSSTIFSLVTL